MNVAEKWGQSEFRADAIRCIRHTLSRNFTLTPFLCDTLSQNFTLTPFLARLDLNLLQ